MRDPLSQSFFTKRFLQKKHVDITNLRFGLYNLGDKKKSKKKIDTGQLRWKKHLHSPYSRTRYKHGHQSG